MYLLPNKEKYNGISLQDKTEKRVILLGMQISELK